MKQGQYRVSTNQTSISNKKTSKSKMQMHSNNKHVDNFQSQSFQLPKIHRPSNNDTTSNRSYDLSLTPQQLALNQHHRLSNIQQSDKQQAIGIVDYEKMTMQQIKREYQRLRKEFNILNAQIRRSQQELLGSRVTNKKSRVASIGSGQTQKLLSKTQLQLYQNTLLLQKLRLQHQQLEKRSILSNSNISKPNADLNQKLVRVKQKLLLTKQKVKLLKKKTKKSGEDILNVEDVHELLEKLEKENKNYELKLASLEGKLQEARYKMERQDQKLLEIQNSYNQAQDYLKLFKLQNQQQAQRSVIEKQYHQLKYKHQVIKKKIQSDQQTNMQKYHQLLKLLQTENQKQQGLSKKLIQEDVNILKARNVVLEMEQQLQDMEGVISTLKQQQLIKKQAALLRKAIQSGSDIMHGGSVVPSPILQQNESQMNDTIEAARQNGNIQSKQNGESDEKGGNETVQLKSNNIRYGGQKQEQLVSHKQFVKRKNDQFKGSIISTNIKKQQPSTSSIDIKSGRKIHSLKQAKQQSSSNTKLQSLDLSNNNVNNTTGNPNMQSENQCEGVSGSKMPSIDELQERNNIKMGNNRNNKSSLSSNNNNDINDEFIHQLEKLNQQLIQQGTDDTNQQQVHTKTPKQTNTKASKAIPSKQKVSPRLQHSIVSPKNRIQSISKQGKIRKQHSKILKPQMLQQIDKHNIEYSKKISQLRKQIQIEEMTNSRNKEDRRQQHQQEHKKQQQHKKQQAIQIPTTITQQPVGPHEHENHSPQISDSDLDEDIDNDIQEINKMVKRKLVDHQ